MCHNALLCHQTVHGLNVGLGQYKGIRAEQGPHTASAELLMKIPQFSITCNTVGTSAHPRVASSLLEICYFFTINLEISRAFI